MARFVDHRYTGVTYSLMAKSNVASSGIVVYSGPSIDKENKKIENKKLENISIKNDNVVKDKFLRKVYFAQEELRRVKSSKLMTPGINKFCALLMFSDYDNKAQNKPDLFKFIVSRSSQVYELRKLFQKHGFTDKHMYKCALSIKEYVIPRFNDLLKKFINYLEIVLHERKEQIEIKKNAQLKFSNYVPKLAKPTSIKQKKIKKNFIEKTGDQTYFRSPEELRSLSSKAKLEALLKLRSARIGLLLDSLKDNKLGSALKEVILRKYIAKLSIMYPKFQQNLEEYMQLTKQESQDFKPQMDESSKGAKAEVVKAKTGNVEVISQSVPDTSTADCRVLNKKFIDLSCTSDKQTISKMTDRWLQLKDPIVWLTSQVRNELIKSYVLPFDAFKDNLTSPNVLPFLLHRYGRFDMKLRFQPASTRLNCGQLQVSWMYNYHLLSEEDKKLYGNIHSASQRDHVNIDAGASNVSELEIPFWQLWAYSNLKKNVLENAGNTSMDLGELHVRVLNPLQASTGVSNQVDIMVFISFVDPQLNALIDSGVDSPFPQMNIASTILDKLELDLHYGGPKPEDRDLPPIVGNPSVVQPTGSQGVSYMNGVGIGINNLRTDPKAQTPIAYKSDMSTLRDQINQWSLYRTFTWSASDEYGKNLFSMYGEPLTNSYEYDEIGSVKHYRITALGALGSMFSYWRGDIKVMLEVASTMFHEGSLILTVVPGITRSVTLEQAKNSYSTSFELKDKRSFEFIIPYYNHDVLIPTRSNIGDDYATEPPSIFTIYVGNRIKVSDNVKPSIEVNVYICGGDNFEYMVPRTPDFGIFGNVIKSAKQVTHISANWPKAFVANSRWFKRSNNTYAASMFYNEVTDYFTQFEGFEFNKIYKVPDTYKDGATQYTVRLQFYQDASTLKEVEYICRAREYRSYPVCICFIGEGQAKAYIDNKDDKGIDSAISTAKQGPWIQWQKAGSSEWTDIPKSMLPKLPFEEVTPKPQMDTASTVTAINLEQKVPPSGDGDEIFGEKIVTMKSLGRRFNYLGGLSGVTPSHGTNIGDSSPLCIIPCKLFKGCVPTTSKDRDNRIREGIHGIVASAYAGFRGGLRFKIVVTCNTVNNYNYCFTVVHKFDEIAQWRTEAVQPVVSNNISNSDFYDSNYASAVQSGAANSVLEIEVPYYKPGLCCSTYPPAIHLDYIEKYYHTLGNLYVYVTNVDSKARFDVDVWYAWGDDMNFSMFQGYPSMFSLSEINSEPIKLKQEMASKLDWEYEFFEPQMDFISNVIKMPASVNSAAEIIKDTFSSCGKTILTATSDLISAVKSFDCASLIQQGKNALSGLFSLFKGIGLLILTQIMQIIANPTFTTISITLVAILSICIYRTENAGELVANIKDCLSKIWNWFTLEKKQNTSEESFVPNAEFDTGATALSMVWSILATILGVASKGITCPLNLMKGLFVKSSDVFRTHVFGVKFFRDFLELVKRVFGWFNKSSSLTSKFYNLVKSDVELADLLFKAEVLCDPQNDERIRRDPIWQQHIVETYVSLQIIYVNAHRKGVLLNSTLVKTISDIYKTMKNKMETLVGTKNFKPIRQKPVCVWISGPPGLGKSRLVELFAKKFGVELGCGSDIYTLTPAQVYYDLLVHQKIILLDDMLAVSDPNIESALLAQFLHMVSSIPLQLPRSAVEKKERYDFPELIFCTSNSKDFGAVNCIRFKEAFERRPDIHIEYIAPKGYKPDKVKHGEWDKIQWSAKIKVKGGTDTVYRADVEGLLSDLKSKIIDIKEINYATYKKDFELMMSNLEKESQEAETFEDYCGKLKAKLGVVDEQKHSIFFDLKDRIKKYFVEAKPSVLEEVKQSKTVEIEENTGPPPKAAFPKASSSQAEPTPQMDVDGEIQNIGRESGPQYFVDYSGFVREPPKTEISILRDEFETDNWCTLTPKGNKTHNFCSHVPITHTEYYRFSDEIISKLKQKFDTKVPWTGIFVGQENLIAFDTPCLDKFGNKLKNCILLDDENCKRLSSYLYSKALHQKSLYAGDVDKPWSDDLYYDLIPKHLWDTYIQPLLDAKEEQFGPPKCSRERTFFEKLTRRGMNYPYIEIDGVKHALGTEEIRKGAYAGKETIIDKGMFRQKIERWIKTSDGLQQVTVEENRPWLNWLILLGGLIVFLGYVVIFLDCIIWFLEFYGILSFTKQVLPNLSVSADAVTAKATGSAVSKAAQLVSSLPNSEGDPATNVALGVQRKIERNTVWLVASKETDKGTEVKKARCLGIYGKHVLILTHYIDYFSNLLCKDPAFKMSVVSAQAKNNFTLELKDLIFHQYENTGYGIAELPAKFPIQFADIRKFMRYEGHMDVPSNLKLIEVKGFDGVSGEVITVVHNVKTTWKSTSTDIKDQGAMNGWTVEGHYEYNVAGIGMCGAFLFDPNSSKPLLAIHTAGIGSRVGIGEPLIYESFKAKRVIQMVTPNMDIAVKEYVPHGEFALVGHVDNDLRVVLPKVSKIEPSLVHDLKEPVTEPAILHPSDSRNIEGNHPLLDALQHRLQPVKTFPKWVRDEAVRDLERLILVKCKPTRVKPGRLTIEQSVCGLEGVPFAEGIELKTSEGYPWVKMRPSGFTDKRWLLDVDYEQAWPKLRGINPKLLENLKLKETLRQRGVVPATFFSACLKDARLPKNKVSEKGKTRLFEMSPIELTIYQRQMHLDFYSSYMYNRRECENTIGININGPEWSLLANDLLVHSNSLLAGDYSKYGPRLEQTLIYSAFNIIKKWILQYWSDKDVVLELELDVLAEEVIHSLVIVDRMVIRCSAGLHSGNPATVILNSLVNSLMVRCVYLLLSNKYNKLYKSMSSFNKCVKLFSNGDDLLVSVVEEILDWFNNLTLEQEFKEYDIKYTSSKKDSQLLPYEDILSVQYLKSQFVPHPFRRGCWLAKLDKDSIHDCPLWVWKSKVSLEERTIQNCDQAVRLAYGWGKSFCTELRYSLENKLQELGVKADFPSWDQLDYAVWELGEDIICYTI